MTFNLIVSVNGGEPVHHVINAERIGIGRAQENQIRLDDKSVSLSHLELRRSGRESYELEDLNSRNGVRVNGKKVKRAILGDGDRILIGKSSVAYFFILPEESGLSERIIEMEKGLGQNRTDSEALQKLIKRLEAERLGHQERCNSLENTVGETLEKIRATGTATQS